MTLLFQVIESGKHFQIDPVQFLAWGIVVVGVTLCTVIAILYKRLVDREKRIEELAVNITSVAVNTTQVLDALFNSVDKIPSHFADHKADLKEAIKNLEYAILRTLDQFQQQQHRK